MIFNIGFVVVLQKGAPLNIFDMKSEVSSILEAESRRLQVRSRA